MFISILKVEIWTIIKVKKAIFTRVKFDPFRKQQKIENVLGTAFDAMLEISNYIQFSSTNVP